jgi:hypothetical protein
MLESTCHYTEIGVSLERSSVCVVDVQGTIVKKGKTATSDFSRLSRDLIPAAGALAARRSA